MKHKRVLTKVKQCETRLLHLALLCKIPANSVHATANLSSPRKLQTHTHTHTHIYIYKLLQTVKYECGIRNCLKNQWAMDFRSKSVLCISLLIRHYILHTYITYGTRNNHWAHNNNSWNQDDNIICLHWNSRPHFFIIH
jgi:hypothetical protein